MTNVCIPPALAACWEILEGKSFLPKGGRSAASFSPESPLARCVYPPAQAHGLRPPPLPHSLWPVFSELSTLDPKQGPQKQAAGVKSRRIHSACKTCHTARTSRGRAGLVGNLLELEKVVNHGHHCQLDLTRGMWPCMTTLSLSDHAAA